MKVSKSKIIKYLFLIILIIVSLILFSGPKNKNEVENKAESEFDRFSKISVTDYENNSIILEQFRGKPIIINSWAVWCPFCRQELPDFATLQQEFPEEVTVIAIDRQEPLIKVKDYTDELGISDKMLFLLDKTDSFYKSIGGFSMPETLFIDSGGNIVLHKRGPMSLEEMREHTQKIINPKIK